VPVVPTRRSRRAEFVGFCEQRTGLTFADAAAFDAFAVAEFRRFWLLFLEWSEILYEGSTETVCTDDECERATFFPNVRLSYAENLLRLDGPDDGERTALIAHRADGTVEHVTRGALRDRVLTLAAHLQELGVKPRDRVVAVVANNPEAMVAALATAAIGATFSAAGPDMGVPALVSRFEQLEPVVLMTTLESGQHAAELARALPTIKVVIGLDGGAPPPNLPVRLERLSEILAAGVALKHWPRFEFNHPLFVMFTSGTTGRPKCIVHGAGGTLLEHVKEHRLHVDLRADDTLYFQTSTGWMMWNWEVSALATAATLVLFEGAITEPATLWRIVEAESVSIFGTSPPYLQLCQDSRISPRDEFALPCLRVVLSTGSVLHDWQFDWVREHVGDVPLQSVSGGTDIIGCFVLGNPDAAVRRGMVQCRSLGLDVRALTAPGERVGELICANPFPSRPLGFLGDDGSRFHEAYFAANPGVWTHGDLVEFDTDGYARMHGRSDGVLKVQGVRIGPAEIQNALHAIAEIRDSLAVEQRAPDGVGDARIALLVVLAKGSQLDAGLARRIRREIGHNATPLHVPRLIVAVAELPTTHNGKRSERAARDAVNGDRVQNLEALRNPHSIVEIRAEVLAAESRAGDYAERGEDHPTSTTENGVLGIWRQVLDLADLDREDSFFDVGGTSLAALRMFRRIHEEFGIELPLSTLMHAATPAALAAVLDDPGELTGGSLVPLAAGSGRPLFLLPWWDGEVLQYRTVIEHLVTSRPVFGVVPTPVDASLAPRQRVPEMAARCLALIRGEDPTGPYALVGHSFGGLLALELAQRLRTEGAQVELLGVVDTLIYNRWHSRRERALDRGRALRAAPISEVVRYLRLWGGSVITLDRVRVALGRPGRAPEVSETNRAGDEAWRAYQPLPYPGAVTLFRAASRDSIHDSLPMWARLAAGGLAVRTLPGGHFDALDEPVAALFAVQLADELVRITSPESSGRPL